MATLTWMILSGFDFSDLEDVLAFNSSRSFVRSVNEVILVMMLNFLCYFLNSSSFLIRDEIESKCKITEDKLNKQKVLLKN